MKCCCFLSYSLPITQFAPCEDCSRFNDDRFPNHILHTISDSTETIYFMMVRRCVKRSCKISTLKEVSLVIKGWFIWMKGLKNVKWTCKEVTSKWNFMVNSFDFCCEIIQHNFLWNHLRYLEEILNAISLSLMLEWKNND